MSRLGRPRVGGTETGFTVMELLIATVIFLVICGAIFGLLQMSQTNYGAEAQMSGSFQEARLSVDQIVNDFNQSGYPSLGVFSETPDPSKYAVGPVAWDPGYPNFSCSVGATCTTPGDFDMIVETKPSNTAGVSWIRYQLLNGTLYRSVATKVAGADPVTATSGVAQMVPFLTNVLNVPSAAQLAEISATYPTMFPAGQPVPIFKYSCDTTTGNGTVPCTTAGATDTPAYIRDVDVTLIVATPVRDARTGKLKIVELNGRGHRLNPSN